MFSKRKINIIAFFPVALALFFPLSNMAVAQSGDDMKGGTATKMNSPEIKKDIAEMYQKMADCMRTDKSMQVCQKEVMKDCPVAKAMGSCPIMDGMKSMTKKDKIKSKKMDGMKMDESM